MGEDGAYLIGDIEDGVVEQERGRRYCGLDGRYEYRAKRGRSALREPKWKGATEAYVLTVSVLYHALRCCHLGSAHRRLLASRVAAVVRCCLSADV